MKAMGDTVLVKLPEENKERVLESGLVIPMTITKNSELIPVEVISVGPGIENKDGTYTPIDLKEGDTVLILNSIGQRIDPNTVMVKTDDIFGVL